MTFIEAALEILRRECSPMHARVIADKAVDAALLSHVGKTPVQTMSKRISASVAKGKGPFVRVKPGVFALEEWKNDKGVLVPPKKKFDKPSRPAPNAVDDSPDTSPQGNAISVAPKSQVASDTERAPRDTARRASHDTAPDPNAQPESNAPVQDIRDGRRNQAAGDSRYGDAADGRADSGANRRRGRHKKSRPPRDSAPRDGAPLDGASVDSPKRDSGNRPSRETNARENQRNTADVRSQDFRGPNESRRSDNRSSHRSDPLNNPRNDPRNDSRNESRNDSRNDSRNESRNDSRNDSRNESRNESRNDSRNDSRNESRNDGGRKRRPRDDNRNSNVRDKSGPFGFADNVEQLLAKQNHPLVGRAIAEKLRLSTANADTIVDALLESDNLARYHQGRRPRFVNHKNGWTLSARETAAEVVTLEDSIFDASIRLAQIAERQLFRKLKTLSLPRLAQLVVLVLKQMGYSAVEPASRGKEGEFHLRASDRRQGGNFSTAVIIRKEGHSRSITDADVSSLRGSLHHYNASRGLIVTTGDVSQDAHLEADIPNVAPVGFLDGKSLANEMVRCAIGVERRSIQLPFFDESWF